MNNFALDILSSLCHSMSEISSQKSENRRNLLSENKLLKTPLKLIVMFIMSPIN